ncbi:class I SAM-dependent methyltransferase [Halovivax limisalsi]|uniref:class I SAM-dependent methyltransferase n=1 Tax=Halovivax limisalsi TaxID=1453760 RepID=UPI001FFDC540|nr:class I SAM-dependent methyltransferase [Halovivax limisalsi]
MAPTSTVERAIEDVPVAGARCLEAGAGAGNMTAALREAGAGAVVAVTDDRDHAAGVRDRFESERPAVLEADLRSTPLSDDSVSIVTAHALFNVLTPAIVPAIADELTRVARPGARLVVDDYDSIPHDGLRGLFAAENAAAELADGAPALTFYPAAHLRACFEARGWRFERERSLLEPVPWTADLLDAHADLARESAARLDGPLAEALEADVTRRRDELGDGIDTGRMYSLAFRLTT